MTHQERARFFVFFSRRFRRTGRVRTRRIKYDISHAAKIDILFFTKRTLSYHYATDLEHHHSIISRDIREPHCNVARLRYVSNPRK